VGGVLGGGIGLVVALFPFAAIGGGLLAATTTGGAVLGSLAGHAAAGMSRRDLKELLIEAWRTWVPNRVSDAYEQLHATGPAAPLTG
jgi:hypothetical protein